MISIHGRYVIGRDLEILEDHAVVIHGGNILDVLPIADSQYRYPQAYVLDRKKSVVSPGFVNAHMHCYGVLAHGIIPPVPITSFTGFLEDYWWPLVENQLSSEDIEAAAAYTALELGESGVTSLCDVLEAPMAEKGLFAEAKVLDQIGLRSVVSTEACERISYEQGIACLQENIDVHKAYTDHRRISAMMCIHTAFTCSEKFLKTAKSMAEEEGILLQLHLNESSYEPQWCEQKYGKRTCEWYDSIGFLDSSVLAAQGVQLSEEELKILGKRNVRMVHVPLSNCEVGGGVAPVPELLDQGLICGLGTDGYINNFFEVMRGAFLIHKGHRADPSVMPAKTVWSMATRQGAQAVFPGSPLGEITPKAPADITVISLSDIPTPVTAENIFDQLILFRNPHHVSDVLVDGRFIKRDFSMLTADTEQARIEAFKAAGTLWERGKQAAGKKDGHR